MAYDRQQPAVFLPQRAMSNPLRTLAFPDEWRERIARLDAANYPNRTLSTARRVRIRPLNALLRVAVPDLISTATHTSLRDGAPWLYATKDCPVPVLRTLLNAWLYDLAWKETAKPLVVPTITALDVAELHWQPELVDLLECKTSDGGTAVPAPRLYTLLPDVIAGQIAQHSDRYPYTHEGVQLRFRQVAANPSADGAELMSWPPLIYQTGRKNPRTWRYSAVLRIALRTVPFDPRPRLHIDVGVRRWTSTTVHPKGRNTAAVYLLPKNPFAAGVSVPDKFAVAALRWNPKTGKLMWSHSGPGQMLSRINVIEQLPDAEQLGQQSDFWLPERDGLAAAVAYHTTMRGPSHEVGAGIMPAERRRLLLWLADILKPHFALAEPLHRVPGIRPPATTFADLPSIPKNNKAKLPTAEFAAQQEQARARRQLRIADNARIRRQRLAEVTDGKGLTVALLDQESATMRDQLIDVVEKLLDLPRRNVTSADSWTWTVDGFTLTVGARPLSGLGGPLGAGKKVSQGSQHDAAVKQRRAEVANVMTTWARGAAAPDAALVVLEGRDSFGQRTTDPKFAIRMGCADAGAVSQFIRPEDGTEDDTLEHRAEAAWLDLFRQIGMRFVPETRGLAVRDDLNQIAFWIVKRRKDDTNTRRLFIPVAVLIRPGNASIMGRASGMPNWVPYPQLLKHLAGHDDRDMPTTEGEQAAVLAGFIRSTLGAFRPTETLVVVDTHNIRYRLPTFQNTNLVAERIQFADGVSQWVKTFGRRLRLVRIGGHERMETPQGWAAGTDNAGIASGLWYDAQHIGLDDARVFYSTVEKPVTHTKVGVQLAKLTPHHTKTEPKPGVAGEEEVKEKDHFRPGASAWNPELLQFTVVAKPEDEKGHTWAAFLHQQRFCSDDYNAALSRPLILHLAKLTTRYALPSDSDEETDDNDGEVAEATGEANVAAETEAGLDTDDEQ
ncbi:DUF3962 domain-containing protein [Micromonospora chersina]|uniref:pPIWI_RE module domain-containing protein n=1 Tax=Micromonospora chersina TaxID=47854 RepID=UPI003455DD40